MVAGRERPTLEIVPSGVAVAQTADDGIDLDKLRRNEASTPQADPFALKNFAPQAPAANAAPAKPSAPPLPFRYFGKVTEGGKTETYVMQGDELISIAPGQKIGDYRVDKVGNASIAFTYLPLKTKQTLDLQ